MMTGTWDAAEKEVLVAILTRETVNIAWALSFRNLVLPKMSGILPLAGMPFDHARNEAVKMAIEQKYAYLMFIDDDIIMPSNTYFKLKERNKDIISGVYYRRNAPFNVCMLLLDEETKFPSHVKEFKLNEVLEVDFVGAGCLLIKTEVFKTLPYPWFDWRVDSQDLPPELRYSEDFAFCDLARKNGYKITVDTGIQCSHIGYSHISMNGINSVRL
jgi:GT2 family glycosyltransferase